MIKKYDVKNQSIKVNFFVSAISFFFHIEHKFMLNNNIYQDNKNAYKIRYTAYQVDKWKITMSNMLVTDVKQVINYLNNDLDLKKLEQNWTQEKNLNSKKYLNWIIDNLKIS